MATRQFLERAYIEYADTINKDPHKLTRYEKRSAILRAVAGAPYRHTQEAEIKYHFRVKSDGLPTNRDQQ